MKSQLKLADKQDVERLLPLVGAYHEFEHIDSDEADRRTALLRLLGDDHIQFVYPTLGCEQEYFLIDQNLYM